jgi:HlyD family secretion protein
MKRFRIPLIILAVLAVLLGAEHVKKASMQRLSGTLEMTEHSVGAPAPGRLAQVLVEEGSTVKKGDVIATLDHYEQTKKDYERLLSLLKAGGVDKQSVEHAELAMKDQEILSPVDGIVMVKVREAGEVLTPGQTVAVIGDPSDRWVRVFVPEGAVNKVKVGQEARLRFDGVKDAHTGIVSYIAPKAEFTPRNVQTAEERVTQTFAVKIRIQTPVDKAHPGVSADVEL